MSSQDDGSVKPKADPGLDPGLRSIISERMLTALNEPLPSDPRAAVIAALERVMPIIAGLTDDAHETHIIEHPVVTALRLHAETLRDLGRGITEPYLRAARIGTRASTASARQEAREVTTLVRALITKGMTQREAIRKVAAETRRSEHQLKNWLSQERNPGRRK